LDGGLHLSQRIGDGALPSMSRGLGRGILAFAPWLMRLLSVAGTAAMFLVGGGILSHGIPWIEHWFDEIARRAAGLSGIEAFLAALVPILANAAVGVVAGAIVVAVVTLLRKVWPGKRSTAQASH
jgi:predicted DNA repair protein MutK